MSTKTQVLEVEAKTIDIDGKTFKVPEFGDGRYSKIALEFFKDGIRWIEEMDSRPEVMEKIAQDFMADFGRAVKSAEVTGYRIGVPNGDRLVTLKEATKSIKGHLTNPLCLAALVPRVQELTVFGLARKIKLNDEKWEQLLASMPDSKGLIDPVA